MNPPVLFLSGDAPSAKRRNRAGLPLIPDDWLKRDGQERVQQIGILLSFHSIRQPGTRAAERLEMIPT